MIYLFTRRGTSWIDPNVVCLSHYYCIGYVIYRVSIMVDQYIDTMLKTHSKLDLGGVDNNFHDIQPFEYELPEKLVEISVNVDRDILSEFIFNICVDKLVRC
jgi:hypothetical protein